MTLDPVLLKQLAKAFNAFAPALEHGPDVRGFVDRYKGDVRAQERQVQSIGVCTGSYKIGILLI